VTTARSQRIQRSAIVLAAGAALLFQQSPANEMLRTNAALNVLRSTGSSVAVALTVAAITVAIEMGSSLLIILGLHTDRGAIDGLRRRMRMADVPEAQAGDGEAVASPRRSVRDIAVALGLGAGLVTLRRHLGSARPSLRADLVNACEATAVVAGVSGLIGYLASGGIENAAKLGLETPARWVIDYGTDTRFWLAVLVAIYATSFVSRLVKRARRAPAAAEAVTRGGAETPGDGATVHPPTAGSATTPAS
jgi:hypothetical protein